MDPGNATQLSYCEFRLEDMTASGPSEVTLSDSVGLTLLGDPLPVGHTFILGSSTSLSLRVFNRDAAAHTVHIQPVITSSEGLPVEGLPPLASVTLQPNGTAPVSFSINTSAIGYFQLSFNFTAGGKTWGQPAFIRYAVIADMRGVGNASVSVPGTRNPSWVNQLPECLGYRLTGCL